MQSNESQSFELTFEKIQNIAGMPSDFKFAKKSEKSGVVERIFMKWLKRFGIVLLSLPIILIAIFVLYEIFGMCVNHIATEEQTNTLQMHLESEIPDIEIISVYSETGNTSGTGNHVDCLSSITFLTEMQETEIEDCMSKYYVFDEWSCYVNKTDNGYYTIYINTSAPFVDNIEGH